ncbi:MAG: peptidyl-prolyl cis-trans isomerase [Myxococcaceae bacterium]|nr:peptidyl-prolyl cis-trans isomerase [Myxococcaceae bacterium]
MSLIPYRRSLATLALASSAVALIAFAGCQKSSSTGMNFKHNRDGTGTPVATFGGDSITVEELKERFAEMSPFARARYQTVQERKNYVEGLVRFELLAQEAAARGLQNDPEVIETAKKVMVQRLIQKELDEKPTPISDAEVAEYYEKHKSDYVKPEMVRMSHLFIAADPKSPDYAAKKKKAEELLAKARALQPLDYAGFGQLVTENSDDAKTKPLKGDMRYLSNEELTAQYGSEVAAAAKTLTQVGQVSDLVVTPKGFHILKLQGRQAALNLGVDQVKTQIQSRLLYERRQENFNKFVDSLKQKAGYTLNDAVLAKMEIDMKAPAKDAKGPPPGYIPPVAGPPVR